MDKRKLFLLLILLFFTYQKVNAVSSCTYKEQANLNSEVAQIKIKYEEKTEAMDPSLYSCGEAGEGCVVTKSFFGLTILNMSENFYLDVKNDNDFSNTFTYDDVKGGVITFDQKEVDKVTNYTVDVYSSLKTNCPNEKYRTIYLTVPKFNSYYNDVECIDNPDFYLCQKYLTYDEPKYGDFMFQLADYKKQNTAEDTEKDNRNILQKVFDFIDDYKVIIGVTTAIIAVGVTVVVIVKKRKETI